MTEHVYKIVQLAGSGATIERAIETAIDKASKTLRNLRWFEVAEMRGHVDQGRIAEYQVVLRVGFTLEE